MVPTANELPVSTSGQAGNENEIACAFGYLDVLRESGVTNMYGARPYLVRDQHLSMADAARVLSAWMKTFSAKHPRVRAKEAISDGLRLTRDAPNASEETP